MKRTLTAEQEQKRDERKAKFKALWKQVAATPELERVQMANRMGLVTCEGHALSLGNTMLIALQCPTASVLGGFRQWLKHGRCVRKGEHGSMIWVPCGINTAQGEVPGSTPVDAADSNSCRFIIGTLFDIGQTEELTEKPVASMSPEIAAVFGMTGLPNVRVDGELQPA